MLSTEKQKQGESYRAHFMVRIRVPPDVSCIFARSSKRLSLPSAQMCVLTFVLGEDFYTIRVERPLRPLIFHRPSQCHRQYAVWVEADIFADAFDRRDAQYTLSSSDADDFIGRYIVCLALPADTPSSNPIPSTLPRPSLMFAGCAYLILYLPPLIASMKLLRYGLQLNPNSI